MELKKEDSAMEHNVTAGDDPHLHVNAPVASLGRPTPATMKAPMDMRSPMDLSPKKLTEDAAMKFKSMLKKGHLG
jgi:hypothetical protein